jgi:site-specific DNA recombinase
VGFSFGLNDCNIHTAERNDSMNIAIYSRVSTDKQVIDGFGIDIQKQELIAEVKKQGYVYKEYTDMGISGTSIYKRKDLQRLLEDIESGDIAEVWVTKLSRLGRNTRDVLNIIYELEKHNVVFKSIRDGIDTSNSMGKVMLQFMSIVSEMERDIIMETTKAGLDYRASIGKIYGCRSILGYDRIGSGKNSYLDINVEESKTIKNIYSLYLKGYGYKAICNELNGDGIKSKDGNFFSIGSVKGILSNPLYSGKIRYNLYKDWNTKRRKGKQQKEDIIFVDGLHKNIISKSKWERAQKRMKTNRIDSVIQKEYYQLTGLLRCPACNARMVGNRGKYKYKSVEKIYRYYVCSNYHSKGRKVCTAHRINATKLDEDILDFLKDIISDSYLRNKTELTKSIITLFESDNLIEIKKMLRVMVTNVQYDYDKKKACVISLNFEEDIFEFLGISFTHKKHKEALNNISRTISIN